MSKPPVTKRSGPSGGRAPPQDSLAGPDAFGVQIGATSPPADRERWHDISSPGFLTLELEDARIGVVLAVGAGVDRGDRRAQLGCADVLPDRSAS